MCRVLIVRLKSRETSFRKLRCTLSERPTFPKKALCPPGREKQLLKGQKISAVTMARVPLKLSPPDEIGFLSAVVKLERAIREINL